jgi:hypothetical protein
MQGYTTKKLTDQEASDYAQWIEEDIVYTHRSSDTLRIAYAVGGIRKSLTLEEVRNLAVYGGTNCLKSK